MTYSAPVPGVKLGSQPLAARQSLRQADASFARVSDQPERAGSPSAKCATDDIVVLRRRHAAQVGPQQRTERAGRS